MPLSLLSPSSSPRPRPHQTQTLKSLAQLYQVTNLRLPKSTICSRRILQHQFRFVACGVDWWIGIGFLFPLRQLKTIPLIHSPFLSLPPLTPTQRKPISHIYHRKESLPFSFSSGSSSGPSQSDSFFQVRHVYYPGLPSHPEHHIAKQQMTGYGGVVSFEIDGDLKTTINFVDALKIPYIAPSFGGCQSIVDQPAIMSYWDLPQAEREKYGIRDNLVWFSFGVEDFDDLKTDILQALETI